MERKIAFLFPGQGAQYLGMGKDFFDSFALARETFEEASDSLKYDIAKIVFDGPENILTETKNCQVGIYVNSIAILRVLQNQFPGFEPFVCAGLSLGEYTAMTAANMLSFEKCLPVVRYRAQFMHDVCEETTGFMAAVLGLDASDVERVVSEVNMPNDLWIANLNCPKQVVISGTLDGVKKGSEILKKSGARKVMPLQVHGAFHSGLMQKGANHLKEKVDSLNLEKGNAELVMNVTGGFVDDLDLMKDYLIKQVTHSVRWEDSINAMIDRGVDLFVEIGCGKVLSGLNKRMGVGDRTINIDKIKDLDNVVAG